MAKTTRLIAIVPDDLKKKAQKKAIDKDISLSAVIRRFLQAWVEDDGNGGEEGKKS